MAAVDNGNSLQQGKVGGGEGNSNNSRTTATATATARRNARNTRRLAINVPTVLATHTEEDSPCLQQMNAHSNRTNPKQSACSD